MKMDNLKRGLNIFKYDENTLEFLPKEVVKTGIGYDLSKKEV